MKLHESVKEKDFIIQNVKGEHIWEILKRWNKLIKHLQK